MCVIKRLVEEVLSYRGRVMTQTTELRWGILGTADISRAVIPAISTCPGHRVVAVASRSAERARMWQDEYLIPLGFDSYNDMLTCGEIDAVYIPLPNRLHAQWTIAALEAGLNVLCEKPIAVNAFEAADVAKIAESRGLLVMEGFMYRHHPQFARVAERIADGVIGKVRMIDGSFSFMLDDGDSIVASADMGGGALLDVGCYPVHAARMITGTEPERVGAAGIFDGVDLAMTGWLQFPGDILARFDTSIIQAERHRLEIVGTTATLIVDSPWVPGDLPATIRRRQMGAPDKIETIDAANPYVEQIRHFGDVISGRVDNRAPISDAVANMRVLDALVTAALQGKVVQI